MSRTGSRSAFTIVELAVVVALLGVLVTMIAPRLSGAAGGSRLREAARRVQAAAQYARDDAVTHRRICRLSLDRAAGRFALLAQADPAGQSDRFEPLAGPMGRPQALGAPVAFDPIRIDPMPDRTGAGRLDDCIDFDPLGRADGAIVGVTDGRAVYTLRVAPTTARVELLEGPQTEWLCDREDLDE
ncbi:MAG: hypothetical protein GX591_06530 [Planctomycetes bacterium]|nr:hypothetical protein [Planctomycetota bacterium]